MDELIEPAINQTEEPPTSEDTPGTSKPEEEVTEPEGANNTEESEQQETEEEPEKEPKPTRLDQHPRFKQVIAQKNEIAKKLELRENKIQQLQETLAKFEGEDVSAMLIDNPDKFQEYLAAKTRKETLEEDTELLRQEHQEIEEQAVVSDIEAFSSQHTDFNDKWNAGELQSYMENHPAVGAIGAYLALSFEDQLAQAREEAAKTERDKILKNQRAKRESVTLTSGSQPPPEEEETAPELMDPKKFGGATAVLAKRMEERLRNRGV